MDKVQVEHKGFGGELMGCMSREIKTFFDLDNAPFSNMVLGEVLNLPGKWSSYPPHHHPQPEVYFYRFDYPHGFGAGFANGDVYKTEQNGQRPNHQPWLPLQVVAPGYAIMLRLGHPAPGGSLAGRPASTIRSTPGCGRPMPTTTSIPITDRR